MVTLHCAVTKNGRDIKPETIRKWHVEERGFRNLGYHYIVQPSGQVHSRKTHPWMRGLTECGAHVRSWNKLKDGSLNIGVCFPGETRFTLAQFWGFKDVVDDLRQTYNIEYNNVRCHYQMSSKKTCPNIEIVDLMCFLFTGDHKYIETYLIKESKHGFKNR